MPGTSDPELASENPLPFVINKEDYINRYVKAATKDYKLGYRDEKNPINIVYLDQKTWAEFLSITSSYVQEMDTLTEHYKVNQMDSSYPQLDTEEALQ